MKAENLTNSAAETKQLGKRLAKEILENKIVRTTNKAFVLALQGDLGGGKTTFLQGFARGLGIKEKILSPTFVIMRSYKLKTINYKLFYHIDCYRIKNSKDISKLGLNEVFFNPKNIVAVEWAERVRDILPKNVLQASFQVIGVDKRKVRLYSVDA